MHIQRVSFTAGLGVVTEALNKLIPIAILFFAQSHLGVAGFGYALYGVAVAEMLLPLVVYGYHYHGMIELGASGQDPRKLGTIISSISSLKFAHALVCYAGLLAVGAWVPSYQQFFSLFAVCGLVFLSAAFDGYWILVGVQRLWFASIVTFLAKLASLGAIIAWVQAPEDKVLFAGLMLGTNALINFATFAYSRRYWTPVWPTNLRSWFQPASHFAAVLILLVVIERFDLVLLERIADSVSVGYYAASARLSHSLLQIASALVLAFFSEVVAQQADREKLTRHVQAGLEALCSLLLPLVVGTWFVSPGILTLIYGEEFAKVAPVLDLHAMGILLSALILVYSSQVLMVLQEAQKSTRALIIGLSAGCILAPWAYHEGGLVGFAGAILLTKLISLALMQRDAQRLVPAFFMQAAARPLLPTLIMGLGLRFIDKWDLLPKITVGACLYGTAFFLLHRSFCLKLWQGLRARG